MSVGDKRIMKKNNIGILSLTGISAFIMLFIYAPLLWASLDDVGLGATVGVNSIFTIEVSPSSLDFGTTDPSNTTPTRNVTVECNTNNNRLWFVQISNISELTSDIYTIPNTEFNWWGSSTGSGSWSPGTGTMSITPYTFYTAGSGEYITTSPVILNLSLNIDIPSSQPAGTYTTTITFTMSE
jgi:hypothetical protein